MEPCLYCCEPATHLVLNASPIRAVRCGSCGLVQTKPVPVFEYTNDEDYVDRYRGMDQRYRRFAHNLLAFVTHFVSSGFLVEVGCGSGHFLEAATMAGFRAEGVEINRASVDACHRKGLTVYPCTLNQSAIADNSVDVVVMSHVLEHVEALGPFLSDVRRVLRPQGWLIVSQPLHTGFIPWLIGRRWYGWGFQQHVWHFDVPSLTRLMRQEGFERCGVDCNSMYYPWLPQPFLRQIHMVGPYLAAAVIAHLAGLAGRGDQMFLAARRRQPATTE